MNFQSVKTLTVCRESEIIAAPTREDVISGESVVVNPPDVIETGGLGPCTGFVFLNKKSGVAVVLEIPDPMSTTELDVALSVVREHGVPSAFSVFLSGCNTQLDGQPGQHAAKEIQTYVLKTLTENGFISDQIHVYWPEGDETTFLHVDTRKKEVKVFAL